MEIIKKGVIDLKSYLRMLLDSKNIRPSELAKKMGISVSAMNLKIRGKIKFSTEDINILLDYLNLPYEKVFTDKYSVVAIDTQTYVVEKQFADELQTLINKRLKEVS